MRTIAKYFDEAGTQPAEDRPAYMLLEDGKPIGTYLAKDAQQLLEDYFEPETAAVRRTAIKRG